MRTQRWVDTFFIGCQRFLSILDSSQLSANRSSPATLIDETHLSPSEQNASAGMMRVNHTGEICAQALYWGQSLTTPNQHLRQVFITAAQEEADHLHWCAQRLEELHSRPSYLNPVWFTGAFFIGAIAGWMGDKWSLGFLTETEHQVFNHLESHLHRLPTEDQKSRTILLQMQQDEIKHATQARALGGVALPSLMKNAMRMMAKCMTSITYYV